MQYQKKKQYWNVIACDWIKQRNKTEKQQQQLQQNQIERENNEKGAMHVSSFKISIFKNKGLDIWADLEINFVHLVNGSCGQCSRCMIENGFLYWNINSDRIVWAKRRKKRKRSTQFLVFMSESETNMVKWISVTDCMQAAIFTQLFRFWWIDVTTSNNYHPLPVEWREWTKRKINVESEISECGDRIYFS